MGIAHVQQKLFRALIKLKLQMLAKNVKNSEGSEILFSLPANKLACYYFMDIAKRH